MHDTLCLQCLHAREICTLLPCFSQSLWSVSLSRCDSLYAVTAHKSKLLQPTPLKCVLKLQHTNCTTVVVTCILNLAAYIYYWWSARLDCYCCFARLYMIWYDIQSVYILHSSNCFNAYSTWANTGLKSYAWPGPTLHYKERNSANHRFVLLVILLVECC